MSKPRSLRRLTRSLMRQRSAVEKISGPVSSIQRLRYASTMPFEMFTGSSSSATLPPASRSSSSPAMLTRAISRSFSRWPFGEPALEELAGLGVDEVGGERAGVAPEQRVRERHVAPEEPDDVQSHEQHRECVDEAGRGVGPQRLREQRPVGQREAQVPRDEHGLQRVALVVGAVRDHGDGIDAGDVEALQRAQHLVLALGHLGRRLLDGDDVRSEVREAHEVARDALRQRGDRLARPGLEREVPREVEERRVGQCRRDRE